ETDHEATERNSDDWRFCTASIGKRERLIGHRRGRRDCRDFGSSTSLHPFWMENSAGDCWRAAWESGFPGRCWDVCAWCAAALLYRLLGSGGVLRSESQAEIPDRVSPGVRFVFWRRGGR